MPLFVHTPCSAMLINILCEILKMPKEPDSDCLRNVKFFHEHFLKQQEKVFALKGIVC